MYRGKAKHILGDIAEGDRVKVINGGKVYNGILMPRSELGDSRHVVIKLANGYNIGFNIDNIKIELISVREKEDKEKKVEEESSPENKPCVSILGTGGTIASKIDYMSGAVHPAFSTSEIVNAVPELEDIASLNTEIVFNILSENMTPEHWRIIAKEVVKAMNKSSGVVVAHGTDTLAYTASAIAFMLSDIPKPVVFVGSQRSSDRPSSDASLNLISAVRVALSDIAEVVAVMHAGSSDEGCAIHRATKVRKMHSSRRDAFKSIDSLPIGEVIGDKITTFQEYSRRSEGKVKLDDRLEEDVALLKIYPGFPEQLFDYYIENFKGIVIEGTGLGHVPENLISKLEEARKKDMPVVMTSQTIFGRVDMKVYSTGRKLLKAGVISGRDMLPEVALVKLMVALGRFKEYEEVRSFMERNMAGEVSERSLYNTFF
ncbi:L-asparaginase 1 [archaeon BMS3Bbin15]|nr:L-asparaginase 1 [archaeon BMS3Bbin15]